jgi:hypothetical protein
VMVYHQVGLAERLVRAPLGTLKGPVHGPDSRKFHRASTRSVRHSHGEGPCTV